MMKRADPTEHFLTVKECDDVDISVATWGERPIEWWPARLMENVRVSQWGELASRHRLNSKTQQTALTRLHTHQIQNCYAPWSPPPKMYKLLSCPSNRAVHGGTQRSPGMRLMPFVYSVPDPMHDAPGPWTDYIERVVPCSIGYHLSTFQGLYQWSGREGEFDYNLWEADYIGEGISDLHERPDIIIKRVYNSVRLVRRVGIINGEDRRKVNLYTRAHSFPTREQELFIASRSQMIIDLAKENLRRQL